MFLIIGLIVLIVIVFHIDFEPILHAVSRLGPLPLVVILLSMIVVHGLEAWGWRLTLEAYAKNVLRSSHLNFVRLLRNNRENIYLNTWRDVAWIFN